MAPVNIRCRENGPFVVEGEITLSDHEGNAFPLDLSKPAIALCRCGASENRPFVMGRIARSISRPPKPPVRTLRASFLKIPQFLSRRIRSQPRCRQRLTGYPQQAGCWVGKQTAPHPSWGIGIPCFSGSFPVESLVLNRHSF